MRNHTFKKITAILPAVLATAALLSVCGMAAEPVDAKSSEGFVMVSDVMPNVLQEIRYFSEYNFVGARIDGYRAPVALLTKEAAEALKRAGDAFAKDGYVIKIYDSYRPQTAVNHFVRWAEDLDDVKMKPYFYPDEEKQTLFEKGYIAAQSSHSRGSTVDMTLVNMLTGEEIDVGGHFDYFGPLSHPDYEGVTPEQAANRMYIQSVMLDNGFDYYPEEWWHFTLRDEPYPETYFDFPVDFLRWTK